MTYMKVVVDKVVDGSRSRSGVRTRVRVERRGGECDGAGARKKWKVEMKRSLPEWRKSIHQGRSDHRARGVPRRNTTDGILAARHVSDALSISQVLNDVDRYGVDRKPQK